MKTVGMVQGPNDSSSLKVEAIRADVIVLVLKESLRTQVKSLFLSLSFTIQVLVSGVRLAKNDFGLVFRSVLEKNCGFRFGFGYTKLIAVSVYSVVFCTVRCLMCMHSTECFPVYRFITVLFVSVSFAIANNDRLFDC